MIMAKVKRDPTQLQQARNKIPASIRAGRVILRIASILFFLDAFGNVFEFGCFTATIFYPEFLEGEYAVNWDNAYDVVSYFALLPVAVFLVFAAIGGISYIKDKGPFMSWVSLAAILSAVLFMVQMLIILGSAITNNFDYNLNDPLQWFNLFFNTSLDGTLYFLGWMLAKNWLD